MHNMQLIWQQNNNAFWVSHTHNLMQVESGISWCIFQAELN